MKEIIDFPEGERLTQLLDPIDTYSDAGVLKIDPEAARGEGEPDRDPWPAHLRIAPRWTGTSPAHSSYERRYHDQIPIHSAV